MASADLHILAIVPPGSMLHTLHPTCAPSMLTQCQARLATTGRQMVNTYRTCHRIDVYAIVAAFYMYRSTVNLLAAARTCSRCGSAAPGPERPGSVLRFMGRLAPAAGACALRVRTARIPSLCTGSGAETATAAARMAAAAATLRLSARWSAGQSRGRSPPRARLQETHNAPSAAPSHNLPSRSWASSGRGSRLLGSRFRSAGCLTVNIVPIWRGWARQ
jgi:hypothetical protein